MRRTARFSFLLPLKFNDNTEVPSEYFLEVQNELLGQFGGVTFQPHPALKSIYSRDFSKKKLPSLKIL